MLKLKSAKNVINSCFLGRIYNYIILCQKMDINIYCIYSHTLFILKQTTQSSGGREMSAIILNCRVFTVLQRVNFITDFYCITVYPRKLCFRVFNLLQRYNFILEFLLYCRGLTLFQIFYFIAEG